MANCKLDIQIIEKGSSSWEEYLQKLYASYRSEIFEKPLFYKGEKIIFNTDLNYNLRHETFEHITTKGSVNRLYNQSRCEKMLWICALLAGKCQGCYGYYDFEDLEYKGRHKRFIIWCKPEQYVIILEKMNGGYMLISAYCVVYKDKVDDLHRKLNLFKKNRKAHH